MTQEATNNSYAYKAFLIANDNIRVMFTEGGGIIIEDHGGDMFEVIELDQCAYRSMSGFIDDVIEGYAE